MKYSVFGLVIILLACTAGRESTKEKPSGESSVYNESFDPLSLNDDDIVVKDAKNAETKQETRPQKEVKSNLKQKEVDGYRVQLLATKNIETASLVEQEAGDRFAENGISIYLIFETPLYKVRIGDFTDRDEAEEIRDRAQKLGYRQAFIVRSKVKLPQNEENSPDSMN